MKMQKPAVLFVLLFLGLGLAGASAQAFFSSRVPGTLEVKFLPPAGGQMVQVAIDDQQVGFLPRTVYVLPGSHRFTFTTPGEQSKTINYPVRGDVVVPSVFNAKAYPLTVNINPPNAAVAIDGLQLAGNTTMIAAGSHTLSVSAPGYQFVTMPFTQPNSPNTLNVTLISNTFPLTVRTNVPEAALAIDGTPFAGNSTSVSAGAHTLSVSAPGYQFLNIPFIQPSSANTLNVTLISNTYPLTVNTNVPNATVAVDGTAFAGNSTSVAAGAHTLSVSAPGYQFLNIPFTQPSSPNTLNVTLIASTGTLQVNLDGLPRSASQYKVFVNGGEVRGPQSLPPGSYSVRVTSGSWSVETTVAVATGQVLTLSPSIQWEAH